MEKILGRQFGGYYSGNREDKREFFRNFCEFFKVAGYDMVSFECGFASIMPGAGALGGHIQGAIRSREDFEKYEWNGLVDKYINTYRDTFQLLSETLPEGIKVIGGIGGGVFETVQDMVGYMDLCYMSADDHELYEMMFAKIGELLVGAWTKLLAEFSDLFCVCRFGDDLGFKSQTLIPAPDIKRLVIPQYKRIIDIIHSYGKPFLLHSCGQIFEVMDDIINVAKIDAKHSNEDVIAPFSEWVNRYGNKIGNFGGIDTDVLCQLKEDDIRKYVLNVLDYTKNAGGIAIGSGNSIPDYVPVEGYLAMINTVREYRGDFKK
jgi:uroporphyrinogen decarboxylase